MSNSAPAATAETVARFMADRVEIVSELFDGIDPGPLIAVEATTGDPHQGGRRVALLRFADRTEPLVYKPRPAASAALYSRLVDWLNERLPGLDLADVPTLVKDGYGWAAFVRPAACDTAREAEHFYYRQGVLLALLYAANGTDAHADNLIAHRDQPVLIDTETLLHPVLRQPTLIADADPALFALERSVHHTVLLPTLFHEAHGAADISGLGGRAESTPYAVAVHRGDRLPPNLPVFEGRPLEAADYIPLLRRGFRDAFTAISQEPESFIKVLERSAGMVSRLLIRPTGMYADLLREAFADDPERDSSGRRAVFEALASAPTFEGAASLLEHEYLDLAHHDIPIFFTRPASRSVWTSRGVCVADVLDTSGLDGARAKVRAMNDVELRRQEWITDAAFATGAGPISHRAQAHTGFPAPNNDSFAPFDAQWAVDKSMDIARRLDELAYRGPSRVNWLSLEPLENDHWTLLPAGGGLPHGYTGIALFLAQLGAITGRTGYLERAAEAVRPLPALLDALADLPIHLRSIGPGFGGTGGIVYALARLSTLLEESDLAERAVAAIDLIARSDTGDRSYMTGRAGAVTALRAVHRELGTPEAADLARRLAADADHPDEVTSGIDVGDDGWCRGTAGIAAAGRLEPAALEVWLNRLAATAPLPDLSLCHGELGVLDALTILAGRHHRAREALHRRSGALPWAIAHGARIVGTPGAVHTPGLLHGLAGTGYGLLRTGFPGTVPSVLRMQPGPAAAN